MSVASEKPAVAWRRRLADVGVGPLAPEVEALLASLAARSRAFSTVLVREPARFLPVVEAVAAGAPAPDPAEVAAGLPAGVSFEDQQRHLRRARYAHLLDLILRELAGLEPIETTLSRITELAERLIDAAFTATWRAAGLDPAAWIVLGYGKLGGDELNLSSDVDLGLVALDDASVRDMPAAVAATRRFSDLLSARTADGFVFRVDWRLRPGGSASPLLRTVDQVVAYYRQSFGIAERLPLLRLRAVGGNVAAFGDLARRLEPTVYRSGTEVSELGMLAGLKRKIELSARSSETLAGFDLKLGAGGIRDLEFFVNALQLLFGGRIPLLRQPALARAIVALYQTGLVDQAETSRLRETWRLYRRLEHRLHLQDERQEFTLPAREAELDAFLELAGLEPAAARADLDSRRRDVRALFDRLALQPVPELADDALPLALMAVDPAIDPDEAARRLRESGATRVDTAFVLALRTRADGPDSPLHPANLEADPVFGLNLFRGLTASVSPAEAVEQFHVVLPGLYVRPYTRSVLRSDPLRLKLFLEGAVQCPFVRRELTRDPALLDYLFLARDPAEELAAAGTDPERRLSRLHRWFVVQRLRAFMATLAEGRLPHQEGEALAAVADRVVLEAADIAAGGADDLPGWAVVALGKAGARELGYASDLDLVFLHDAEGWDAEQRAARFFRRFVTLVGGAVESLRFYVVDTRIRPEGSRGALVTGLAAFQRYHATRASQWEKMALLKARVLAGRGEPAQVFPALRQDLLAAVDPARLLAEVQALRQKRLAERSAAAGGRGQLDVKLMAGGLLDLEVSVQARQLTEAASAPGVRVPSTRDALHALAAGGRLPATLAADLTAALDLYRSVEQTLDLYFPERGRAIPSDGDWLSRVEARRAFLYPRLAADDLPAALDRTAALVHAFAAGSA